ncbi:hypothetical protein SI65_09287 [Aspergillus cristatus]|uniref:Fumarylacetoacetase-like C-terminal domain-containing protein n=1 Tax=Aspergillus cristatus TaxID=573508 RepID=A0A1E3B4I8_ASPCR|nr:hypothetical protein SI65_09287 [Aspergillus cristatus]
MAAPLTNYIAFVHPGLKVPRIGHLNWDDTTIQPLSFASGTPLENLYQVIQAGQENIKLTGRPILLDSVQTLPPISGRDILAVGKNYAEHAVEFNKSGYDSSDKVDQPSHPVLFTKRATSIVGNGHPIALHRSFTQTLDYEGELGVIIGKVGFDVRKENAMEYVWGYTIINDVTARERQRDHKQFFIGKSGDTYCPMGPVAVPSRDLPDVLAVQTFVNGEKRQNTTTNDLIFSVPTLIETVSRGTTIQPGDVIATGTPAGVGFGQKPPVFLQPGDEITVSISGLGELKNKIIEGDSLRSLATAPSDLALPNTNVSKTITGGCLTQINAKPLYYKKQGSGGNPIVFVHGLGGSSEFYTPLINSLNLDKSHELHLADLEGHGLSPTSPLSVISIESLADDLAGVFDVAGLSSTSSTTLVAHSMGCLVALQFAIKHPDLVHKLILLGPAPNPLPNPAISAINDRAELVREKGMLAVVDAVCASGTSDRTKASGVGLTAVRLSLLATEPESYAKACTALAGSKPLSIESVNCETLIVTGDEDKVSPPALCTSYSQRIVQSSPPVVLKDVGHWHVFEDVEGVATAVRGFL